MKTLTGSGTVSLLTAMPFSVGDIATAGTVVQTLTLNAPDTVQCLSLTESGALRDINTPSTAFTAAQTIIMAD